LINIQQLIAQMQQQQQPTGRAPPQQPFQVPSAGNHMMPGLLGAYGQQAQSLVGGGKPPVLPDHPAWQSMMSYGQQAQQLAGLLGGQPQVGMAPPYRPGMFMPGFRPGIDQPAMGSRSQGSPRRRIQEY
jgi:hypothetical protein